MGSVSKKFFSTFIVMMYKRISILILTVMVLWFGVSCESSKPEVDVHQMKMAAWPGFFLKIAVDWYMPDAVWTVKDSRSVDIAGKVIFRDQPVEVVLKSRLPKNDSLWTIGPFINNRAADSLETVELFDGMAHAVARTLYQVMQESLFEPKEQKFSNDALDSLEVVRRKCEQDATNPKIFKTLPVVMQSEKTMALAECMISNTQNEEIIRYYSNAERLAQWGLAYQFAPPKVHEYVNGMLMVDSALMSYFKIKNDNGVLKKME